MVEVQLAPGNTQSPRFRLHVLGGNTGRKGGVADSGGEQEMRWDRQRFQRDLP